ncbi:MAG: M23 family metallopeptidase [Candidatus Marinimicrobia bacterium]|nr:M23 family metallopeptidase [Candidatus Neomarinimicrobiota bacterium]
MENPLQINNSHLLLLAGLLYFFTGCAQPPPSQPETPPLPEEQEITAKQGPIAEPEPAPEPEREIVLPPIIVQDTVYEEIILPPIIIQDTIHKEIVLPPVIIQDTIHVEYVVFPGTSSSSVDFSYLSDLQLLYPCKGVPLPEESWLLPNASRSYRHGIHRGIDFVANYGSEIRAVASGTVIRADHHFQEFNPNFREQLLAEAATIGRTPSDVFNNILVGQSVIIDHGTEMVPGKRLISLYAHLSHIDNDIQVESKVEQGQRLGLSGNSGTEPATLGEKGGAHLHFELIIQDAEGERYLGQGLEVEEVKALLDELFID